jgi:hypothetical protein
MNKKTLLIDQPGHFGDILICLPIAKWYSEEYDVEWLCPEVYHNIFRDISYCTPVTENNKLYNKVIDLSFGLRKDREVQSRWKKTQIDLQSFIVLKYMIAEVPLIERWNLTWCSDLIREEDLYKKVIKEHGTDYILTHHISVNKNSVHFKQIEDYNIFNWYKVIVNAKEIHCIDSLLCNFVEVIPEALKIKKIYYQTSKVPNLWDRTLLINNWQFKVC